MAGFDLLALSQNLLGGVAGATSGLAMRPWYERVASDSNLGDAPSRLQWDDPILAGADFVVATPCWVNLRDAAGPILAARLFNYMAFTQGSMRA